MSEQSACSAERRGDALPSAADPTRLPSRSIAEVRCSFGDNQDAAAPVDETGKHLCQGSGELIASSSADLIAKLGSVKIAKSPSARTRASSAELIHGDAS